MRYFLPYEIKITKSNVSIQTIQRLKLIGSWLVTTFNFANVLSMTDVKLKTMSLTGISYNLISRQ